MVTEDRLTAPGAGTPSGDAAELTKAVRARVDGEARFGAGSRGTYSTDGSNYRQVPIGVVVPSGVEAGAETVAVCAGFDVPVPGRGGGAGRAGQCTGNRLVSVYAEQPACGVQPGIVRGMIGNDSRGGSARAYGKAVGHVRQLGVLACDGTRYWVGPTSDDEFQAIVNARHRTGGNCVTSGRCSRADAAPRSPTGNDERKTCVTQGVRLHPPAPARVGRHTCLRLRG